MRENLGTNLSKSGSSVSRRAILQGSSVGLTALMLAGCSTRAGGKPEAAVDKSSSQKSLRFDGRETYRNSVGEDFPQLGKFSDLTGISVTFTNQVGDDNTYYQEVKSQLSKGEDIGADAAVLSDWMAAKWIRLGYVQEFRHDNIPNFQYLRPRFRDFAGDPERKGSMPWRSGITGIAWNTEYLPNGLTSVSDLWAENLHGRVGSVASMRDILGIIMLDHGIDISSKDWGDKEFTETIDFLRPLVTGGQLRSIKGDKYKDDLIKGNTIAAIAKAGDILRMNEQAGKEKWGFAVPTKGGVLWNDVAVIPIGSTHRANVESFVNYYYDPSVAVQVAADTGFISPVDIRDLEVHDLDPEVAGNRLVFPTPVTFESLFSFRILDQAEEQRYMAQFQSILLAASSG